MPILATADIASIELAWNNRKSDDEAIRRAGMTLKPISPKLRVIYTYLKMTIVGIALNLFVGSRVQMIL